MKFLCSNESSCEYYDWNYEDLAAMTFEEALKYFKSHDKPDTAPCNGYSYPKDANSMVVNVSISLAYFSNFSQQPLIFLIYFSMILYAKEQP